MAKPPKIGPTEQNTKPWDPERPFQRVGSPSFKPSGAILDGDGHQRGTRRRQDFPRLRDFPILRIVDFEIFEKAIGLVPAWARTLGPATNDLAAETAAEHELYGRMERSFQTWTDAPGFQWHRWYDWNLHVQPAPEFDWLRGRGNRVELDKPGVKKGEIGLDAFIEDTMECEWDTGSFGARPGAMYTDLNKGLTSSWIWPMTGDWVWVVGRSIYDGGHEFEDKKNPGGQPLCRSELHPCKAVANVRREAFQFPGTGRHVPAMQFAFFASRHGGYVDAPSLAPAGGGKDYEFLVDLPLMPDEFQPMSLAVGKTPDFPFNRVGLRRPEPIFHVDFTPYANAFGVLDNAALRKDFRPKVKFEVPDASKPREVQARITIPLTALAAKRPKVMSYGVVVSLGWPDPFQTQAKTVKRCTVQIKEVLPVQALEGADEWRMKFCINNRWFHLEQKEVLDEVTDKKPTKITVMTAPITLFLHEDDHVRVHSHGMELELMDGFYFKSDDDRTVKFNRIQVFAEAQRTFEDPGTALKGDTLSDVGAFIAALPLAVLETIESIPLVGTIVQAVEGLLAALKGLFGVGLSPTELLGKIGERAAIWKEHIDIQPPRTGARSFVVQRVIARNAALMMAETFKVENSPLAMCDPGHGFPEENKFNPLPVKEAAGSKDFTLKGVALKEDEKLAELFERVRTDGLATFEKGGKNRKFLRYELNYTVDVQDQIPKGSGDVT
jgi:hypothetical protein